MPLLSAADALPPGIVPDDLRDAEIADGELRAAVPAPLVAWAAAEARGSSPRMEGVVPADEMARSGRVRIQLHHPFDFELEVP